MQGLPSGISAMLRYGFDTVLWGRARSLECAEAHEVGTAEGLRRQWNSILEQCASARWGA